MCMCGRRDGGVLMRACVLVRVRVRVRVGMLQDVDYDENFKFYMTTKMSNPHYLPDVCIKASMGGGWGGSAQAALGGGVNEVPPPC
jgi:hypothetical protein